ncbi:hypothetical protein ROT00_00845 [Agromyces mediolanus]|uniref:hypothetical protein n=1 Tax=Agromyces mediolanus TaxID=41986 RepID=UPI003839A4AC
MTPDANPTMPEVVTYDGLPAAAGGAHSLRVKRPTDAQARVQRFLAACTVPAEPAQWTFSISADGDPAATERLAAFAADVLGGPRRTQRVRRDWNVRPESVAEVLEAIESEIGATTKYGASLATLSQSLPVQLVDPATGEPFAGLSPEAFGGFAVDDYGRLLGVSGVRANSGTAGSSLSLWLNLPADERLSPAARYLQDHLPFRLSTKHWRRWQPTRARDGYRSSKLPSPLAG